MNDAAGVRRRQCIGDLDGVTQQLIDAHAVGWNKRVECFPGDELHDDEVGVTVATDVVNRDNAGMIERARGFRFVDEALSRGRIVDLRGR